MAEYGQARDALARTIRKVFPNAKPVPQWAGVEAWGAPRPAGAPVASEGGTYDPKLTVIGIADRKSGPTIYFLDPGDYFVLETEKKLLTDAGFKLGRGCIMHTRKAPLPTAALEELFRRVKARDAAAAKGGAKKKAKPKAKAAAKPAPAAGADAVDAYLARLPPAQRMALGRLRKLVTQAAPEATETMSYGMPTWKHAGTNLVHMAAFKEHCSFFPGSGTLAKQLAADLARFETSKGTIRFAPNKPLPPALVKKIVKMRVQENEARAAKRAAKKTAKKPGNKR